MKHIKKTRTANAEEKKGMEKDGSKLKLVKNTDANKGPRDCIPLGT